MRPTVADDGTVLIQSTRMAVPNVRLESVLGEGANGVVFRGTHEYLRRPVAVKFWLRNRERDSRDKFKQGILEARKAADADSSRHVVRIHEAGELQGTFYAVMEFFQGITLAEWIRSSRTTLAERSRLAWRIVLVTSELASLGITHGDLHSKNILVKQKHVQPLGFRDFKIVDFGTSHFASDTTFSVRRHWKTLEETINKLTQPFSVTRLEPHTRPNTMDPHELQWWYLMFFRNLPYYLWTIGADWLKRDQTTDADVHEERGSVLRQEVRLELMRIRNQRSFEMTPGSTGSLDAWMSLDDGWVEIGRDIRRGYRDYPAALEQLRAPDA